MLSEFFQSLTSHKKQTVDRTKKDVRTLVALIGDSELGSEVLDVDMDYYADVLEAGGWSEADIRLNVDKYKQRVQQATLAKKLPKLQQAAAAAEAAHKQAMLDEGKRRREAQARIAALAGAAARTNSEHQAAIAAHGDLVGAGFVDEGSKGLVADLAEANRRIDQLRIAVDPTAVPRCAGYPVTTALWANIGTHPAWLASQTKTMLAKDRTNASPERTKQLKSQLAAAEKAVASRQKELADAEKSAARLNAELQNRGDGRLQPENFTLARANASRDERSKQLAREMGFGTVAVG